MYQETFDLLITEIDILFFTAEEYFLALFSALSQSFHFDLTLFALNVFFVSIFGHKNDHRELTFIVTVSHSWDIFTYVNRLLCSRKIRRSSLDKDTSERRNYEAIFLN